MRALSLRWIVLVSAVLAVRCGGSDDTLGDVGSGEYGSSELPLLLGLLFTNGANPCMGSRNQPITATLGPVQFVKGRVDYVLAAFPESREFTTVPTSTNKTLGCSNGSTTGDVTLAPVQLDYGGSLGTYVLITLEVWGFKTVCSPTAGPIAAGQIVGYQKLFEVTRDCDLAVGCWSVLFSIDPVFKSCTNI